MIHSQNCLTVLLVVTVVSGCNILGTQQKTRYIEPVLPSTMSCKDLVDHLNRQSHGLHAWQSTDSVLTARLPNGMPLRLSANIACAAPNQFRLRASNLVANVDLGANQDRCWFYVKPGEGKVLTWRHEDSELLQHLSVGVPRIDPDWLMVVLGVMPLDSQDFDVSPGPAGSKELWLTAVADDFDGRSLRRVIKVDTLTGRAREHVIYNHERSPLIRASLKDHKTVQGFLVPQTVKLEFPEMDTDLTLKFGKIEPNCSLSAGLWCVPNHRNVEVVDLGNAVRAQLRRSEHMQAAYRNNDQPFAALNAPTAESAMWNTGARKTGDSNAATSGSVAFGNSMETVLDGVPTGNVAFERKTDFGETYLRGVSDQPQIERPRFYETAEWKADEPEAPEFDEAPDWDLPAEQPLKQPTSRLRRGWSMNWFR